MWFLDTGTDQQQGLLIGYTEQHKNTRAYLPASTNMTAEQVAAVLCIRKVREASVSLIISYLDKVSSVPLG